jgi:hypothetical protein
VAQKKAIGVALGVKDGGPVMAVGTSVCRCAVAAVLPALRPTLVTVSVGCGTNVLVGGVESPFAAE